MMGGGSFRGLAIVAAVGFFVPLLLGFFPNLRLQSVVAEIAVGIALGPSVLGWVEVDGPIRVLSQLGLASLLFLAGLEIEIGRLRGTLLKLAGAGSLLSFGLSLALCYGLAALGFLETPLFVAIIISAGALGMVIPILKDAGEISTPFGQLLVAGMSMANFGTIILLAVLFSAQGGGAGKMLILVGSIILLSAIVGFTVSGMGTWKRLTETMVRLQETTAMIRIRGAAFFVAAFVALAQKLGLEVILGGYVAGALLGFIDRDEMQTHPQFRMRLQAVGYGVFIPVFFVTSGIQFDMRALFASGSALAGVPVFLAALLVVRGVPAILYRGVVDTRRVVVAGLLQATSLPIIVAGVRIGVDLGKISQATAAALMVAGMLSVLIFPLTALTLLREKNSPGKS